MQSFDLINPRSIKATLFFKEQTPAQQFPWPLPTGLAKRWRQALQVGLQVRREEAAGRNQQVPDLQRLQKVRTILVGSQVRLRPESEEQGQQGLGARGPHGIGHAGIGRWHAHWG